MRFRYAALSFALASLCAAPAMAEEKQIGVGGDLLFTLPLGDMADATGPLIGASIRAGYYVMPQFEAYARVGYQAGLKKEQTVDLGPFGSSSFKYGINNVPVMVGGRYFLMQPYSGLYGNLELGLNMLSFSGEGEGTSSTSDSKTRIGTNIGAGYVISEELPINIGVQFAVLNLLGKESSESSGGGVTVKAEEKTLTAINFMVGYEARF